MAHALPSISAIPGSFVSIAAETVGPLRIPPPCSWASARTCRFPTVSVRWPSGKTVSTQTVPEGTLLTVYENPADSPSGSAFSASQIESITTASNACGEGKAPFPSPGLDTAAKPARLRVYTTFATSCASCVADWPLLQRLTEQVASESIDIVAVPIDQADDDSRLGAYARQWRPAFGC